LFGTIGISGIFGIYLILSFSNLLISSFPHFPRPSCYNRPSLLPHFTRRSLDFV